MDQKSINDSIQYRLLEEQRLEYIRESIISKRVVFLGRVEIYINEGVLTVHGYDLEKNVTTLVYIGNKINTVDKVTILRAMQLNSTERYYLRFDNIFIDMNSVLTPENLMIVYSIKNYLDQLSYEFDEFFEMINYSLQDYLLEYPEDNTF